MYCIKSNINSKNKNKFLNTNVMFIIDAVNKLLVVLMSNICAYAVNVVYVTEYRISNERLRIHIV